MSLHFSPRRFTLLFYFVVAAIFFLAFCGVARAQEDVVAARRANYPTPISKAQAVEMLRGIAGDLGAGWGILRKTAGNNCEGYACDIVCRTDGSLHVDVLIASETEARPTWQPAGPIDAARCEAVVPAPGPDPVQTPDLLPLIDALAARVTELEAAVKTEQAERAGADTAHGQLIETIRVRPCPTATGSVFRLPVTVRVTCPQ